MIGLLIFLFVLAVLGGAAYAAFTIREQRTETNKFAAWNRELIGVVADKAKRLVDLGGALIDADTKIDNQRVELNRLNAAIEEEKTLHANLTNTCNKLSNDLSTLRFESAKKIQHAERMAQMSTVSFDEVAAEKKILGFRTAAIVAQNELRAANESIAKLKAQIKALKAKAKKTTVKKK